MRAVAERFFGRGAATAERHAFLHRKFISVAVDEFHFALHDVGPVFNCLDCDLRHSALTVTLSARNPAKIDMDNLSAYMNDHLAGATAALEMLDHLIKRHKNKPLGDFLKQLEQDIEEDVRTLQGLIDKSRGSQSALRKAGGWLAEKFARTKFKAAGEQTDELGLLQALEMLELGVRGKQLLWRALSCARFHGAEDVDLIQLERRAVEQQERLERQRMQTAREVFAI